MGDPEGGGGTTDALPSCDWSYAGGGAVGSASVTRNAAFYVRVTVTDNDLPQQSVTTVPEYVNVNSGCSGGGGPDPNRFGTPALLTGTPEAFALDAPAPNPFTASSRLRFALPEAAHVSLRVYDLLGREVAVLANGAHEAGYHMAQLDAARLPAGTYVCRLVAGRFAATRTVTVLK